MAVLVFAILFTSEVGGQPSENVASAPCTQKHPRLAVQEVMATNLLVNRFDHVVLGVDWASVDFETWTNNLSLGWEWDENSFLMNMFAHPLHGSLYFNAGRINCLSFWESIPLTFFGSWTWEYFGEIHRPSFNDFFMTSFGGIALGEISHRVAASIRNTELTGFARTTREIAALLINPIDGFNRLIRGDWSHVGPNPEEREPGMYIFGINAGFRTVYEDSTGFYNSAPTLVFDMTYGDSFDRPYRSPFDVFSVRTQLSPGGGGLNALQAVGRLFQRELPSWSRRARHAFVVGHHFDYLSNPVYRYGSQSISLGLISRYSLPKGYHIRTRFSGDFVVLGAVDSPPTNETGRTYDFGPSVVANIEIMLEKNGIKILTLANRAEFLHSVSGTPADHVLAFSGIEGNISIFKGLGLGFLFRAHTRNSQYTDSPAISRPFVENNIFLTWTTKSWVQAKEEQ